MVPPTLFVSAGVAVLQLCKEVYIHYKAVKRFRYDCQKLAHFVHRIEAFITETEDDADMTDPGWEQAFTALHESLLEVVEVFEDCARYGMLRSMINADELNLRLNAIAQRLTLSLQLIPIQKAKATDKRMAELKDIQCEIRSATFAAVTAAEQQSAALKRLMDQSRVDNSKTHEMLEQVMLLLQGDITARAMSPAAAAAGPGPAGGGGCGGAPATVDLAQLQAEIADLHDERERAIRDKNVIEEQYLEQVIAIISAMEAQIQAPPVAEEVPVDLRCPITYQLLHDPVILVDSHQTYERAAIQEWLDRGNTKDPITGTQITTASLLPNILVRKLAQEWLQAHPSYKEQQAKFDEEAARNTPRQPFKYEEDARDLDRKCSLDINPETAAVLAAFAEAEMSCKASKQGPPVHLYSSGQEVSTSFHVDDEKLAAQQAYNRAVAAAAQAQTRPTVVALAGARYADAYGSLTPPQPGASGDSSSSGSSVPPAGGRTASNSSSTIGSAAGSSFSFAPAASIRSLPSITEGSHQPTEGTPLPEPALRPATTSASELYCVEEELHASYPDSGRLPEFSGELPADPYMQQQQGQEQHYGGPHRSQSMVLPQQQQQHRELLRSLTTATSSYSSNATNRLSSSPSALSGANKQERAAAAVAAATAMVQHHSGGGFTLDTLHATLGRAAETRYKMTARHVSADEAEELRQQQQQQQQEQQQQRERAYLQQHVEQLQRQQSPMQQRRNSLSASQSAPVGVQQVRSLSELDAHHPQQPSSSHRELHHAASCSAVMTSSAAAAATKQLQRLSTTSTGGRSTASVEHHSQHAPRNFPQPPPPSVASAPSVIESAAPVRRGWSALGLGRSSRRRGDADVAGFDDTASISSTGSGDSRRSVGRSVMGMLKQLQYTAVYEDGKC